MFRKFAFITVLLVICLGIFFICLNILDIAEDYRLDLPIALFNTIFVAGAGTLAASVAAVKFSSTGRPEIFGLGGGALILGIGILLYGWSTRASLETRITVHDSAFLIAGAMHITGVVLMGSKQRLTALRLSQKQAVILIIYLVILAAGALVAWALYRSTPLSLSAPRGLFRGAGAILFLAAALLCFRAYRKSTTAFYYWYSLGLVLMAIGEIFLSQGALESRVAWLGRASQYAGGLYFLTALFGTRQRMAINETA